MTRVALYTRVSTEDQAKEGFSLDAQLKRLRLYAEAQEWEVAGEYVDEGHSGRTINRPQYRRLMQESQTWDTLLVLKMDRIHRNSRNFMAMMDDMRKHGKEFASVTESLDTSTAMGRFVMDIIQRIAQLESDQIGERTTMGLEEKFSQEPWAVLIPSWGYDVLPTGRLVQNAAGPHRRSMALQIINGQTRREVANDFNLLGVKPPRGGLWGPELVGQQVINPSITGSAIRFGRVDFGSALQPIVSIPEYLMVLRALKWNPASPKKGFLQERIQLFWNALAEEERVL